MEGVGTAAEVGINVAEGNYGDAFLSVVGFVADNRVSKATKKVSSDQELSEQGRAILDS